MRSASEAYQAQANATDMAGARGLQGPTNAVYRLPDPEEYADGSLPQRMALRVREMYQSPMHRERAKGEKLLQWLDADMSACEEWLKDVGEPVMPKADDWDDDTDWHTEVW